MNGIANRIANLIEIVSGIILGGVTLIIFSAAMARYVFHAAIPDAFDLSRLLLAVGVMWGLAAATYKDSHIRVDVVWMLMPRRMQWIVDIFAELVLFAFLVLFAWMFFTTLTNVQASNEQTFDLRLQVWPAYALGWAGLVAAVLMGLLRLIRLFTSSASAHGLENKSKAPSYHD